MHRAPAPGPGDLDRALLAAVGVHAGHPGVPDVLACASLAVEPGRRLAVLGANGSGKTTLLRVLSGAHRPTQGYVVSSGQRLRPDRAGLRAHRQRVQLVLQDPDDQLFSAEVRQDVSFGPLNLGLPPEEAGARVEQALDLLGLAVLADRPVHHLSFGQRKRVAVAGALAMRPQVLLLDEPTAGLDPAGVEEMLAALATLERRGTTLVLSTHDVDLAWRWADDVALVVDGAVQHGPAADLLTRRAALSQARLHAPWVVRLLAALDRPLDPRRTPPRTVEQVARELAAHLSGHPAPSPTPQTAPSSSPHPTPPPARHPAGAPHDRGAPSPQEEPLL